MSEQVPAPTGLGDRGARYWRLTVASFDPTPSEFEVLHELCRTLDLLDAVDRIVAEDGPKSFGAAGQATMNPAVAAGIGLRATMHRLMSALSAFTDENSSTIQSAQTTRARQAADARWQGHTSRRAN